MAQKKSLIYVFTFCKIYVSLISDIIIIGVLRNEDESTNQSSK